MRTFLLLLLGLGGLLAPARAQRLAWEKRLVLDPTAQRVEYLKEGLFTPTGHLLVTGVTGVGAGAFYNISFLLNPASGDSIWKRQGTALLAGQMDLKPLAGGRFAYLGTGRDALGRSTGPLLQKWGADGRPQVSRSYPVPGQPNEAGLSLLRLPDGGFWLGSVRGDAPGVSSGRDLFHLLRTDSSGTMLWQRGFGWSGAELMYDAQLDGAGNALLFGMAYPPPTSSAPFTRRLKLVRVSPQGDSLQAAVLAPAGVARTTNVDANNPNKLLVLRSGAVLLTGWVDSLASSGRQAVGFVLCLDAQLRPRWQYVDATAPARTLRFSRAVELQDGSALVLGTTGPGQPTYGLYHFSATGQLLGTHSFTTQVCPGLDFSTLIPEPGTRTLYAGGGCLVAAGQGGGAYLARLELPTTLPALVTAARPAAPALAFALFPNPAREHLTLRLSQPLPAGAVLCLYSPLGQLVRRFPLPRTGAATLPLAGLPAGTYLARLLGPDGRPLAPAQRLLRLP